MWGIVYKQMSYSRVHDLEKSAGVIIWFLISYVLGFFLLVCDIPIKYYFMLTDLLTGSIRLKYKLLLLRQFFLRISSCILYSKLCFLIPSEIYFLCLALNPYLLNFIF